MLWSEMTSPQLEKCAAEDYLVVLPCGSVEQHGWHLPVDTDSNIITTVAQKAVAKLDRGLVLPTLWCGFSPQHQDAAGTISLSLKTYASLVEEIVGAISAHGFKRMVLLNGHGANEEPLKAIARGLVKKISIRLLVVTYWYLIDPVDVESVRQGGQGSMGHAGEMETSIQLYLRPDLVEMDRAVSNPIRPKLEHQWADMFDPGPAFMVDTLYRSSGPVVRGDATCATAKKGRQFIDWSVDKVAAYLKAFMEIAN